MSEAEKAVVDFSAPDEGQRWLAVNDGVMGGLSQGGIEVADGLGVFSGDVSMDNDGGFASVRRRPADLGLAGTAGIRLRVRGDGKVYRFRAKTDDAFDGVIYQGSFTTRAGEWTEHELAYWELYPSFRGRRVEALPLDPARIRQVGFLIAEEQEGSFRLEIAWIKAFAQPIPE